MNVAAQFSYRTILRFVAVLAAGLALAGCARSPFQKIPEAELNQEFKAGAERIAYRLLTAWKEGRYEALSDDFTQEMKDALDPRAQRQAHLNIKAAMGDLEAIEFVEAVASKNLPTMILYRFRGTFTGAKEKPEVRVVLDERGRVAGFWCLKWTRTVR
ncbi:MAG: DUF3887 domain-containing protein [Kiritimatiellae bacterium]|nr:DUF3887 domain-containing protein [Kiritimatiellia bacterium]